MTDQIRRDADIAALRQAGADARGALADALEQRALEAHADGHYDRALADLGEARALVDGGGSRDQSWRRLTRRMANACERRGDLQGATRLYDECRPPAEAAPDERYGWANGRALLAERMADWELADALYTDVVGLFPRLQSPGPNSVFGLSNAATWAAACGEAARAGTVLAMFERALARQADHAVTYELPMIQAEIARAAGDLAAADQRWAEVAEIARRTGQPGLLPSIAAERSSVLLALGRRDDAISLLGTHLAEDGAATYAMNCMAAAVALGACLAESGPDGPAGLATARAVLRKALCTEAGRGMPELEWRILAALADVAAALGRRSAAIVLGKAAVEIIAGLDQPAPSGPAHARRELGERLIPHGRLVDRLIEAGRFPEAVRTQAAVKSEIVYDLARRDGALDVRTKSVPMRPDEQDLLAAYRALCAQLRRLRSRPQDASPPSGQADLDELHGSVAAWADRAVDGGWTAVEPRARQPVAAQRDVEDGTAHLHYFRSGDAWQIYVRTRNDERSCRIDGRADQIAHESFDLRDAIMRQSPDWRPLAARLFDRLVRPIDDLAEGRSLLRISSDPPLGYVPFAALHDGQRCLVERVALSVDSGIGPPARPVPPIDRWRILLFGSAGAGDKRIEHVDAELDGIAAAWAQARRVRPFTARRLEAELAAGAEVLHLASHFHLEPARSDLSHLALDDGDRLTLPMFRSSRFNLTQTELLVLSACDTAVEDMGPFGLESFAGLAQAKGARSVLGSLWPVADASAARLMQIVYAELFRRQVGQQSVASALRRAQLQLLRDTALPRSTRTRAGGLSFPQAGPFQHPYHWAGYVLYQ